MAYGDREGLHGIGGWLVFFLFGFAFVSPLGLVIGTYSSLYGDPQVAAMLGERWGLYQAVTWALVALGLGTIGYTTWRLLYRHDWITVKITMGAIVLNSLGLNVLDVVMTVLIARIEPGVLLPQMAPDFIRGTIYSALWIGYFQRSVRIRNTYGVVREDETVAVFE
ncbi:MAG: DUF2569 family protein [Novosphingobium sp.]|uniref:DUF2569 family protein n=1 Tax=Novosphingobium sp. TaxID=1874826 RepID=UPI0032B717C4